MNDDMARYRGLFVEEAREHMAALSEGLVRLEAGFRADVVDALFRAAHSMKGMAATLGFEAQAALSHALEDHLDDIRTTHRVAAPVMALLFEATDALHGAVDAIDAGRQAPDHQALVDRLRQARATAASEGAEQALELDDPASGAQAPEAEPAGPDPFAVAYERTGPPRCALAVTLSAQSIAPKARLLVVERSLKAFGTVVAVDPPRGAWGAAPEAGPFVVRFLLAGTDDPAAAMERVRSIPDIEAVAAHAPVAAAAGGAAAASASASTLPSVAAATVRVSVDRIDALLDRAGELRIAQAQLDRLLGEVLVGRRPYPLTEALVRLQREIKEIHAATLELRTLPVSLITGRFHRLVRDTAHRLGKRVRLVLEGQDTQIDRSVLEVLADPIMHLVKNALGHGVERPSDRAKAGKPEEATITITFRRVPSGIEVDVRDDGRGIDRGRVVQRAVEAGHLEPGTEARGLDDEAIWALLTRPGFTTAEEVTEVSGRGVGLDVVQAQLNALGGSIRIESQAGQGTTVRLRLPPTLALVEALECRLDGDPYYVPVEAIITSLPVTAADEARGTVLYRDPREAGAPTGRHPDAPPTPPPQREVALIDLDALFGLRARRIPYTPSDTPGLRREATRAPEATGNRFGIVVERHAHRACLLVDGLGTIQELVVKSVDVPAPGARFVSGASIRGDGRVGLLLDIPSVLGAGFTQKAPIVARP